jgi:hypothetical protein
VKHWIRDAAVGIGAFLLAVLITIWLGPYAGITAALVGVSLGGALVALRDMNDRPDPPSTQQKIRVFSIQAILTILIVLLSLYAFSKSS